MAEASRSAPSRWFREPAKKILAKLGVATKKSVLKLAQLEELVEHKDNGTFPRSFAVKPCLKVASEFQSQTEKEEKNLIETLNHQRLLLLITKRKKELEVLYKEATSLEQELIDLFNSVSKDYVDIDAALIEQSTIPADWKKWLEDRLAMKKTEVVYETNNILNQRRAKKEKAKAIAEARATQDTEADKRIEKIVLKTLKKTQGKGKVPTTKSGKKKSVPKPKSKKGLGKGKSRLRKHGNSVRKGVSARTKKSNSKASSGRRKTSTRR